VYDFSGALWCCNSSGMRNIVADLIRSRLVDVVVSTGACMVHDAIEAVGGTITRGIGLLMTMSSISTTYFGS